MVPWGVEVAPASVLRHGWSARCDLAGCQWFGLCGLDICTWVLERPYPVTSLVCRPYNPGQVQADLYTLEAPRWRVLPSPPSLSVLHFLLPRPTIDIPFTRLRLPGVDRHEIYTQPPTTIYASSGDRHARRNNGDANHGELSPVDGHSEPPGRGRQCRFRRRKPGIRSRWHPRRCVGLEQRRHPALGRGVDRHHRGRRGRGACRK